MARGYWLVKSEPEKYSWDDFVKDGSTYWDGVRNAQARNNLRAMKKGDLALYYHSNEGKEVVGVAKVTAEAKPDPTAKKGDPWVAPELGAVKAFAAPVSLAAIKADPKLRDIALVKLSRMTAPGVTSSQFLSLRAGTFLSSWPR